LAFNEFVQLDWEKGRGIGRECQGRSVYGHLLLEDTFGSEVRISSTKKSRTSKIKVGAR